jgi:hypothetical protein
MCWGLASCLGPGEHDLSNICGHVCMSAAVRVYQSKPDSRPIHRTTLDSRGTLWLDASEEDHEYWADFLGEKSWTVNFRVDCEVVQLVCL